MPFDADLILIDGSVVVISTTAASFVNATSLTRSGTTGAAVVDLKETGRKGLAAVLIIPALTSSTSSLVALIQGSDAVAFGSDVHNLVQFDIAAATTGTILASECTSITTVVRRFSSKWRYIRAKVTPAAGAGDGSFSYLKVYLTPAPFKVL